MKIQILFSVLGALILCVSGSPVQSQSNAESAQVPESKAEVKATSAETFNLIAGVISHGDKLLYRGYHTKPAIADVVQTEDVKYNRGDANVRISYISALAVGGTSTAYAQITWGGINENNITIRLSSVPGYGYEFWVEIWGHVKQCTG